MQPMDRKELEALVRGVIVAARVGDPLSKAITDAIWEKMLPAGYYGTKRGAEAWYTCGEAKMQEDGLRALICTDAPAVEEDAVLLARMVVSADGEGVVCLGEYEQMDELAKRILKEAVDD